MILKKRLTELILGLTLAFALSSCNENDTIPDVPTLHDGTFEGIGEGRGGSILVRITVSGQMITERCRCWMKTASSYPVCSLPAKSQEDFMAPTAWVATEWQTLW